jgi:hypothetical protein
MLRKRSSPDKLPEKEEAGIVVLKNVAEELSGWMMIGSLTVMRISLLT